MMATPDLSPALAADVPVNTALTSFIRALRMAGVRVSSAETLDAFRAAAVVGIGDKALLRTGLAAVLAKTSTEKALFASVFDSFFRFDELNPRHSDAAGQAARTRQHSEAGARCADAIDAPAAAASGASESSSALGQMLLAGDPSGLGQSLAAAALSVQIEQIQVFTQKGLYTRRILDAMGQAALLDEIRLAQDTGHYSPLADELQQRLSHLREQVRGYVERQFFLHADHSGERLQEKLLRTVKLSNLDRRTFGQVQKIVLRMARKLMARYSHRRRLTTKQGQLHLSATIRQNMGFDGQFFHLRWRRKQIDRASLFVICDVSGSMVNYSRFMLMLLYALERALPEVRAFAFAANLTEVTALFQQHSLAEAIDTTLRNYAGGATDYGQAFADFHRLCLADINHRSTVMILGDSRNNYGDPRTHLLSQIYNRVHKVMWLNPEPHYSWHTGDAVMRHYGPFCHQKTVCNSLLHLERVVSRLLSNVH